MKAYNWKEYSEAYCEKIVCHEHNEDNTLCLYEAFDETVWNVVYFIVYKDKVVYESYNYNEMVYKFWGMNEFYKHLKEEKELMEDNQKLYVGVQYNFAGEGYLQYAVDGIAFKTERLAQEYCKIKPDSDSLGVEEITIYPDKDYEVGGNK